MDKYDYDIDVDALVIRKSVYDYAYSIDVTSEIILDVDSNSLGRFGDQEQELFEALGKVLEKSLWSEKADV